MRIQIVALALSCAAVSSKFSFSPASFLAPGIQTLAEDTLNLEFNENLSCGGCVRAGYTFCAQKDDKRRNLDRCCNAGDFDCMWN